MDKIITEIENLTNLILKGAKTISDKEVKSRAKSWIDDHFDEIFKVLGNDVRTIKSLQYLATSIDNRRLIKKDWLKNLNTIKKFLNSSKFSNNKQILFFDPAKPFTAYQILKELFATARKSVYIFDGYVEEGTLDILVSIQKTVEVRILTNNTYGKFLKELPKFKKEFPNSETKKSSTVHDRYFIIDDNCFLSGNSLHSLGGNKSSYLIMVDKNIADIFMHHFNSIWSKAIKIL